MSKKHKDNEGENELTDTATFTGIIKDPQISEEFDITNLVEALPNDYQDTLSPFTAPCIDPDKLKQKQDEPEPARRVDDTLLLDAESQDKLMHLRAQQEQLQRLPAGGDVVVMFTDLVGSTAYYEKHGDLMGRQKMLTHNALLFPIVRNYDGRIIKTIGDSIMACFDAVDGSLSAAEEMQEALRQHNQSCASQDDEIHIRIGINSGSAIVEDGDLHGDAVNVAARIQSKANGDEIFVSQGIVENSYGRDFHRIGPIHLKGKAEPEIIYLLNWSETQTHKDKEQTLIAGRYLLGEVIGKGPTGTVYEAQDTHLNNTVTVKLLYDFMARNEKIKKEFINRVQTMSPLIHKGTVSVIDCSTFFSKNCFYVTQRIKGENLAKWMVQHGSPNPKKAVPFVIELAEIIAKSHQKGIFHGGLKPENILIDQDGQPYLLDWGMSCLQRIRANESGESIGSVDFLAPEQVTDGTENAKTDVHALGAILYYLLTKFAPDENETSVETQENPHPELMAIVNKAMATKPSKRYTFVEKMLRALRDFNTSYLENSDEPTDEDLKTNLRESPAPESANFLAKVLLKRKGSQINFSSIGFRITLLLLFIIGWALISDSEPPKSVPAKPAVNKPAPVKRRGKPTTKPKSTTTTKPKSTTTTKPRPTAEKAAQGVPEKGVLIVITSPPADVYINDQKIGRTAKKTQYMLKLGDYKLKLVVPEHKVYREVIKIKAEKPTYRRIKLKPK